MLLEQTGTAAYVRDGLPSLRVNTSGTASPKHPAWSRISVARPHRYWRPCKSAGTWPSKMSDLGGVRGRWLGCGIRVSMMGPGRFHTVVFPTNGGDAMIGREAWVLLRHY